MSRRYAQAWFGRRKSKGLIRSRQVRYIDKERVGHTKCGLVAVNHFRQAVLIKVPLRIERGKAA